MSSQHYQFKLVFIGDGEVGKTTFLNRHRTGNFQIRYIPTMGVEVSQLNFETNCGNVSFSCWDISSQELKNATLYFKGADAFFLMFDVTSEITYKNISTWYTLTQESDELKTKPFVLCGNKVDCKVRNVKPQQINFHRGKNMFYYDISSKSNYNFEKPFTYLMRKLLKEPKLCINGSSRPKNAEVDAETVQKWQNEL